MLGFPSNQPIFVGFLEKKSSGAITKRWQRRYFKIDSSHVRFYNGETECKGSPIHLHEINSVRTEGVIIEHTLTTTNVHPQFKGGKAQAMKIILDRGSDPPLLLKAPDISDGAQFVKCMKDLLFRLEGQRKSQQLTSQDQIKADDVNTGTGFASAAEQAHLEDEHSKGQQDHVQPANDSSDQQGNAQQEQGNGEDQDQEEEEKEDAEDENGDEDEDSDDNDHGPGFFPDFGGWQKIWQDDERGYFYYNPVTDERSWEKPPEYVQDRAERLEQQRLLQENDGDGDEQGVSSSSSSSSSSSPWNGTMMAGLQCLTKQVTCIEGTASSHNDGASLEASNTSRPRPDLVVIFLHGIGGSNKDFSTHTECIQSPDGDDSGPGGKRDISLAAEQSPDLAGKTVTFVLPQAPERVVDSGSRSGETVSEWWRIDDFNLSIRITAGKLWDTMVNHCAADSVGRVVGMPLPPNIERIIRRPPTGMIESRQKLVNLVAEVVMRTGCTYDQVALCGFSQGSMSAMDAALALEHKVAGVVMLGGAPIAMDVWRQRLQAEQHRGIRVLISHGRQDRVLPYMGAEWNEKLLDDAGAYSTFHPHDDGHNLGPPHVLAEVCKFWSSLVPEKSTAGSD
jgi:predicted esterase